MTGINIVDLDYSIPRMSGRQELAGGHTTGRDEVQPHRRAGAGDALDHEIGFVTRHVIPRREDGIR
jgi:hypothetical protein